MPCGWRCRECKADLHRRAAASGDFVVESRSPVPAERLVFREARPADGSSLVRAIHDINQETDYLGEPGESVPLAGHAEEQLQQFRATDAGVYFLACGPADIVGYLGAFAGELRRIRSVVSIAHLGVRTAHRGRGIGTRLLAAAESWARDRDAHRLELYVDEANTAAIALYQRRGFLVEGRIADAVWLNGRWHAHYLMGRRLTDRTCHGQPPVTLPSGAMRGNAVTFRIPQYTDAAPFQAFEWELLTGSPWHLKLPAEVADLSDIRADILAATRSPARFMLAAFTRPEPSQAMIGCVQAWPALAARMRHDTLVALDVLPSWSGCGIGRALAQALETWGRGRGLRRLTTWALAHNERGLRFATAQGFCRETLSEDYAIIDGRSAARIGLGKVLG